MSNELIIPDFNTGMENALLGLTVGVDTPTDFKEGLKISLVGYIDTYNSNMFQKKVEQAIKAGYNKIIFDCAGLTYISSTGIGAFASFVNTLQDLSGDFVLLAVSAKVVDVFKLLGFDQFFKIYTAETDAVNYLKSLTNETFHEFSREENTVFPYSFKCPLCDKSLKVPKKGTYRCSGCKTLLAISELGNIKLV